jgi:hypothetical protein
MSRRVTCVGFSPCGDDLAHERLARDHAEERPVLLAHEHRANLGILEQQPTGLRILAGDEHRRRGHHRVANDLLAHG